MGVMSQLNDSYSQYCSRLKRNKDFFDYARATSFEEIIFNIQKVKDVRTKKDVLRTLVKMTNSSLWVSRSALNYIQSLIDIRYLENINLKSSRSQEIIAGVSNNRTIEASDEEVFKTIYDEIVYSHLHADYKCTLIPPKLDITIVLVSGVFNEIFSTPAFQRGAEKLLDECQIKHFAPNVDGTKSASENALKLKKQINQYLESNPDEKLWFFCFSKGGIDTLHYLKAEATHLKPNIIGISFIATPLLGSDHINHKALKVLNTASKVPEAISKKIIGKDIDPIFKGIQQSLSKSYRENWFKKNYDQLPKNIFYTAVAFESKWHKSHVYMMFTKAMLRSSKSNDGVVDVENAQFPDYFKGQNLGVLEGHHLVGSRSSFYDQEALMKAHLIFLRYKKLV
jgi:hypothetical protein